MRPTCHLIHYLARSFALFLLLGATAAGALDWPQEVRADEGTIIVYQPQPESLQGNVLRGRAAMSLQLDNSDETIFGAFWFQAKLDTDRAAGTALIRDVRVTQVKWPDSKDAAEQRFTAIVEGAIPENGFEISMERLTASLQTAEAEVKSLENLRHDPPAILFSEQPAVLLLYDGKPRYGAIDNSPYERVLNTPMAVVRKKGGREYWLSSGKFWYRASDPMGPWTHSTSPPADLVSMLTADDDTPQPDTAPAIVTADEPSELIVTQGKPAWISLTGGELLYVENTESPWLRDLPTGNMYLLLSGRWYRAKSAKGPWTFVPADELPAGFSNIPPDSDIGGLRSAVAGTEEAEDAVLDAQVPQTAAIKRSEASLTVSYDGKPTFEKIPGTSVAYAVNTASQVLEVGGRYYAVDNGVWFTAAAATGPWQVADSIPREEIRQIPPSSPVYNTTYVHIYESTPEVVYVGYLPGYLWSFPYYGVPVYGTGWYYPPYFGGYYYPRPPTWGFNVGYNPWTGWSFGLSYSNGFFSFGMAWGGGYPGGYRPWGCCNGWYGGGYRGPVVINTGDINIGNNINIGNRTNIGNKLQGGDRINLNSARDNLYTSPANRARLADAATAKAQLPRARPANNRANDVFADGSGNVARRVQDGWEARDNGQWSKPTFSEQQKQQAAGTLQQHTTQAQRDAAHSAIQNRSQMNTRQMTPPQLDRHSLDRAYNARQMGMQREMARPQNLGGGLRRR